MNAERAYDEAPLSLERVAWPGYEYHQHADGEWCQRKLPEAAPLPSDTPARIDSIERYARHDPEVEWPSDKYENPETAICAALDDVRERRVHNHGPDEGRGTSCPESLVGACILPSDTPADGLPRHSAECAMQDDDEPCFCGVSDAYAMGPSNDPIHPQPDPHDAEWWRGTRELAAHILASPAKRKPSEVRLAQAVMEANR